MPPWYEAGVGGPGRYHRAIDATAGRATREGSRWHADASRAEAFPRSIAKYRKDRLVTHASVTNHSDSPQRAERKREPYREALRRLTVTSDAIWPTILRVTLGGVMLPHALQKTLGWFGGYGPAKTMAWFTTQLHMPVVVAATAILLEQLGALALIVGLFTRLGALAIGAVMIGAVLTVHWPNGFFMNWLGTQPGEGFEFHLLVLAMVAALAIEGGGRGSIDAVLSHGGDRSAGAD